MDIVSIILSAAKSVGVSGALLLALCSHESANFTQNYSPMDKGSPSFGSCQIKYSTGLMLGFKGLPADLMDPKINARYAALYLKYQQERYGDSWVKITASYNSGSYFSGRISGCPRNLRYLRSVQKKLPTGLQYKLDCGNEIVRNY